MQAVIFDFDGTLANSFNEVAGFLAGQAGRQLSDFSAAQLKDMHGLSMKDLAFHLGVPAWKLPLVYFRGRRSMHKRMTGVTLFPGIVEVLEALHKDNYQLLILSSNSARNIKKFLSQHGLSGYFNGVYGSAGWFGKGAALKAVVKKRRLSPTSTVYVGDEVRDVYGAHRAGMPIIAVDWGFASSQALLDRSPTLLVHTPAQLQKALLDWGRP